MVVTRREQFKHARKTCEIPLRHYCETLSVLMEIINLAEVPESLDNMASLCDMAVELNETMIVYEF